MGFRQTMGSFVVCIEYKHGAFAWIRERAHKLAFSGTAFAHLELAFVAYPVAGIVDDTRVAFIGISCGDSGEEGVEDDKQQSIFGK